MDINSIITEEEFEELEGFDYDILNKYLTRIIKLCVEESLKSLPAVMTHLSSQAAYLKSLSDNFYIKNKDLDTTQNRKIVAQTIESVEAKNPGKKYQEILNLAAPMARKMISITSNNPGSDNIQLKEFDSKLGNL